MAIDNTTKRTLTPEVKQKALVSALAIKMAKSQGDPLYDQYKMYMEKAKELKRKILMKYAEAVIKRMKERGIHMKIGKNDLI